MAQVTPIMNREQLKRFTKNIQLDILTGCWIWSGYVMKIGYGVISFYNKPFYAHRLSYTYFNGKIPERLELDHLCRNKACCNPRHLEAVTHKENLNRGIRKQRYKHKEYCIRGHKMADTNLKVCSDGYKRCKTCKAIRSKESRMKKTKLVVA